MNDPPQRRWFQFSLRTLMIGVTLFAAACGYVGAQAKITKERRKTARWAEVMLCCTVYSYDDNWEQKHANDKDALRRFREVRPPLVRRLLGDSAYSKIVTPYFPPLSNAEVERLRGVFPGIEILKRH